MHDHSFNPLVKGGGVYISPEDLDIRKFGHRIIRDTTSHKSSHLRNDYVSGGAISGEDDRP